MKKRNNDKKAIILKSYLKKAIFKETDEDAVMKKVDEKAMLLVLLFLL
jgi:hypothetical protein